MSDKIQMAPPPTLKELAARYARSQHNLEDAADRLKEARNKHENEKKALYRLEKELASSTICG